MTSVNAFSFNLSHLIQVPLILLTMGYLLWIYAQLVDRRPLFLQLVGLMFILHYPLQELMLTEIKAGGLYQGDSWVPEQIWKGLYPEGIFKPLIHMVGMAFTIAASCVAVKFPQKKTAGTLAQDSKNEEENTY